jgi:isopentenyldiphosphate isomerase
MQELLDVVDTGDRITDTLSRNEIHSLGLRHRAVHILIFNDQGQLFLQKRSMSKDMHPGLWDTSAAGHVDAGESYTSCALREIIEELGVAIDKPLQSLFKLPATPVTGMEFIQVYQAIHNGPFILEPSEIEAGAWFPASEITTRVNNEDKQLTEVFRIIWQLFTTL